MRTIHFCRDAEQLYKAMEGSVDVVLCDIDLPGMDFSRAAQEIRHNRVGANPFAVLVGTARASSQTDTLRVIRSGIDDLLLKPTQADLVLRRISALAEARKQFVATDTFIGPSRRSKRREDGSDDDLIDVPNTLRGKLIDNQRQGQMQTALEQARKAVVDKKAETRLKTIIRTTQRLIGQWKNRAAEAETRRSLELIAEKAEQVAAEDKGKETAPVAAIAVRVAKVARRALANPEALGKIEISLLGELADALSASYTAATGAAAVAHLIAAHVDDFLSRN